MEKNLKSAVLVLCFAGLTCVKADYATNGLVLYMDASAPGSSPFNYWKPVSGGPANFQDWAGFLHKLGDGGKKPVLLSEPKGTDYRWFYRFHAPDKTGCSQVGNLGADIHFDYDQDFTIEACFRVNRPSVEEAGRSVIFSDQYGADNGYRFGVRCSTNSYYTEFVMRDNKGAVRWQYRGTGAGAGQYGQWYYITMTYEGRTGLGPIIKFYTNGQYNAGVDLPAGITDFREADFLPPIETGAIGAGVFDGGLMPLDGDVAAVRVYSRVLSASEILTNYNDTASRVISFASPSGPEEPVPALATYTADFDVYTKGPHRRSIKRLPATRRVTIAADTNDSLYLCRADVEKTASGKLVCIFMEADQHVGSFNNIVQTESYDNGHTWTPYHVIAYGRADVEGYNFGTSRLVQLAGGTLAINVPGGLGGQVILRSYDEGLNWTTQNVYNAGIGEPGHMRLLSNGVMIFPTQRFRYGADYGELEEIFYKSYDMGQTWWSVGQKFFSGALKVFNEAEILELGNGKLWAISCSNPNMSFSDDYGETWSRPVLSPVSPARPHPGFMDDGQLLMTFRDYFGVPGYTAWIYDPKTDKDIFRIKGRAFDESRIELFPDRLVLDAADGDSGAVTYCLPKTATPQDRVIIETTMRCEWANTNGCVIDCGIPIQFMPSTGRVSLLQDASIYFTTDITQFHDYRIDRDGASLKMWCDNILRIDTNIQHVLDMPAPDVDIAAKDSFKLVGQNGRYISFGNFTFSKSWGTYWFSNNGGKSEWKNFSIQLKTIEGQYPDYSWSWSAANGVYPDQYVRDRFICFETEGCNKLSDHGYGGWTQIDEDTIFVVDYTRGDGQDGPVPDNPFIRGYWLKKDDFTVYDSPEQTDVVLHLEAADPGDHPTANWVAIKGCIGELVGDGNAGEKPVLKFETDRVDSFRFAAGSDRGGLVEGFSADTGFDYDADFSIQTWIKPGCPDEASVSGRMNIVSTEDLSGNGYRLTARRYNQTGQYYLEFVMRDNTGTNSLEKAKYQYKTDALFNLDQWCNIVLVYDGVSGLPPSIQIYVNGRTVNISNVGDSHVPPEGLRNFGTANPFIIGAEGSAGSAATHPDSRMWYDGDIAMVKVYIRTLAASEILDAYAASSLSKLSVVSPQVEQFSVDLTSGARFSGSGPEGWSYRVLAATNLLLPASNWILLATGTMTEGAFSFSDAPATNYVQRFYRILMP